mmetsp:Transcript_23687/g.64283  ORF Transcript_23687/g.64283 Transcript_23687/m.64283 type:complete len:167 (-) Transcript_23687:312-812(-)
MASEASTARCWSRGTSWGGNPLRAWTVAEPLCASVSGAFAQPPTPPLTAPPRLAGSQSLPTGKPHRMGTRTMGTSGEAGRASDSALAARAEVAEDERRQSVTAAAAGQPVAKAPRTLHLTHARPGAPPPVVLDGGEEVMGSSVATQRAVHPVMGRKSFGFAASRLA